MSHEFRRKILLLLEKEGYVLYTDLMDKLGLDQTGQLNFHLRKLGSLINKNKKYYFLTEDGKRILKILNINKRILSGEEVDYLNSKGSEINRVGVIICNCNTEISNMIDIISLEKHVSKLRNVVSVKIFENLCQEKNLERISNWVRENFLNKVVIAACSPKTHQHIFERIFNGIIDHTNIEIANIREQCCWVHHTSIEHKGDPFIVLQKAQLLIEAAIERILLQKEIKIKRVEIEKSCAILGGGIAGMTVALDLARAGIKVYLIEKSPTLGGMVARWHRVHGIGDCSICFISELVGEIVKEKNIQILTNTEIEGVSGEVGNFTLNLIKKPRFVDEKKCTGCKQCIDVCGVRKPNQYEFNLTKRKVIYFPFQNCYPYVPLIEEEDLNDCLNCRICERACMNKAINLNEKPEKLQIKVGAKVVAVGADIFKDLKDYNYDPNRDIISSAEFERMLSSDGITEGKILKLSDLKPPDTISIIQNIGSTRNHQELINNIVQKYIGCIKVKNPKCIVNIFSKTRPQNEDISLFKSTDPRFHYVEDIKINRKKDQNIIISNSIEYQSDLIILNVDLIPNKDLRLLRKTMDFTLNDSGFMSEDTLASGIYGAGTILGPLNYYETVNSAHKVALNIISLFSNDYILAEFTGIEINENACGLCSLCVKACPYNALSIENEKLSIDKFKCKGCGTCVSVCPTNAIDMNIDTTDKILKSIEILSKFNKKPKILAFCCRSCGYAAADDAGLKKLYYHPNVFVVRVPCTGRVDANFILKALECGFDGVLIVGCRKDACRYIDGTQKVQNKIHILKKVLGPRLGRKIILKNLNAVEGNKFSEICNKFYNILKVESEYEA
ncbi:MAG: hydrogenase iron-sulfur subunit [Candidatus Lokiarchaeota archaeon]|nr:hydrogenase iron-sulfur subunit [Candidatus Lokiarchaeota archaeon]